MPFVSPPTTWPLVEAELPGTDVHLPLPTRYSQRTMRGSVAALQVRLACPSPAATVSVGAATALRGLTVTPEERPFPTELTARIQTA